MASRSILTLAFGALLAVGLMGCGSAPMDFSGYPDKARERLYSEGRLGGDNGLASFDLRKAWQAALPQTP